MNPNDFLAGVNGLIAAAMLCLAIAFFTAIFQRRVQGRIKQVFVLGMGFGYAFLMLDYATTATLRYWDIYAFTAIPHSFLPESALFPLGISLLMIWRSMLAVTLWGVVIYTILLKDEESDAKDNN